MPVAQVEISDNLNQKGKVTILAGFTLNEMIHNTGSLPFKMLPHHVQKNLFQLLKIDISLTAMFSKIYGLKSPNHMLFLIFIFSSY